MTPRRLSRLAPAALALLVCTPARANLQGLYVIRHVLRGGESAASLIQTFRTTRGSMESCNPGVNLDTLRQGDSVRILSTPGVFQRLKKGFTVSDVAQAYQTSRDSLLSVNGITDPRRISVGREIFVPDAEPLPAARLHALERKAARTSARLPRGLFVKPLGISGRLVQSDGFGRRINPITGEPQVHTGADLVAPYGTPILAARDGTVEFSGYKGGYGKLVVLQHAGDFETYYGHATELFVKEGDAVVAGQLIARVGATGDATAPHLHFEVRQGGSPKNPQRFMRGYF